MRARSLVASRRLIHAVQGVRRVGGVMSNIGNAAQQAVSYVTGQASGMISVPEIENDPLAVRKLAIAVFQLVDALKLADAEIAELRKEVRALRK